MSTLFNISKMVQRLGLLVGILLLTAMSAQSIAALSDYQARLDLVTEENGYASQDERLAALMDLVYDYQMTQYPEAATWLGYAGQNDRWTDYSPEAIEQRNRDSRTLLKAVETISVDSLGESAILDFQLFHKDLSANVAAQAFPDELMPINQMGGVQQDLAQMISLMPSRKLRDYRDIIARLESADSLTKPMKIGLKATQNNEKSTLES